MEDESDIEHQEEYQQDGSWYVPEKLLNYVCLDNYCHTAKSDKFLLGVRCPFCGGLMECDSIGDD